MGQAGRPGLRRGRHEARSSDDGYAPVVGVRFTATPNEQWLFNLQGQSLDADCGAFVGYDWFKLDVERSGSDGLLGLDRRFKGPVAGVTLAF